MNPVLEAYALEYNNAVKYAGAKERAVREAMEDDLSELGFVRMIAYQVYPNSDTVTRVTGNVLSVFGVLPGYYNWKPLPNADCEFSIIDSPSYPFTIAFRAKMSLKAVRERYAEATS